MDPLRFPRMKQYVELRHGLLGWSVWARTPRKPWRQQGWFWRREKAIRFANELRAMAALATMWPA